MYGLLKTSRVSDLSQVLSGYHRKRTRGFERHTSHLDYLQDLGITMIWFNPIFPSPQKDNGYDVSNYTAINPDYGTMDDFETLVREAGKRGIGIMLDMVFNHTSTEHEWFQKALAGNRKYKDYYIWKKGKDGHLPTNWPSKFGGPAWQYVEKI